MVRYDVRADKETGIIYNEEWDEVFDEKLAYYNKNRGPLNIRKGPGDDFDVIAYLKPGEGGFVRDCNFDLTACYMEFGGSPESGWVNMELMTQGEIEYKE
jgi:uncharacterized protein YraI